MYLVLFLLPSSHYWKKISLFYILIVFYHSRLLLYVLTYLLS